MTSSDTLEFRNSCRAFSLVGDRETTFSNSTPGGDAGLLQNIGANLTAGEKISYQIILCSTQHEKMQRKKKV